MQIISDDLHKMSRSISGKNKKYIMKLLSAEFAQRVAMIKKKLMTESVFISVSTERLCKSKLLDTSFNESLPGRF